MEISERESKDGKRESERDGEMVRTRKESRIGIHEFILFECTQWIV